MARMLVVVCRSHCEWRQTSSAVLGEGHVAFDDAGAHAGGGFVGFLRVLGELQRRAAMPDREVAPPERPVALPELRLERALGHLPHEIKGAGTELDAGLLGEGEGETGRHSSGKKNDRGDAHAASRRTIITETAICEAA